MITNKKDLKQTLLYEKEKYSVPKIWWFLSFFGLSEKSIIWKYQRMLRKWEYHLNCHHKILTFFLKERTIKFGRKYGISIAPNIFDKGLKIKHLGSILVNSSARVGKNCVLHINTAIVATSGSSDAPQLGDDCVLGIGSTLVGGIKIGNNVIIGAGAVVTKSFLQDSITLGGVPDQIISYSTTKK